jgi:argininosuccinate lyase
LLTEARHVSDDVKVRRALWEAIADSLEAHVIMLRDTAIVDDSLAASLLTAIDGVRRGQPTETDGSLALAAAFDERVDSLAAAGAVGAVRIARARHDLAATADRLVKRDRPLALMAYLCAARAALLDLAESHVFTLMVAWSATQPLQPTNLAHFLTGTIAPLAFASARLRAIYPEVDRTPLGAGALAGPGLPVDRDETADLLGSEGPVESTFDALASVEHLVAAAEIAAGAVAPMRRLLSELLLWVRTDPNALRFADELLAPVDANLPHFRPAAALQRLLGNASAVEDDCFTVARQARALAYGATGEAGDQIAALTMSSLGRATDVAEAFASIVSGPIEINRAWLARHAGRDLVTSGDLADFLMAEEGMPPGAARDIAAITSARASQEGLEASGITPALIDSAALLIVGRELGIEIERLGAYLAPRRFIEKRTVLGGPAAPAVRDYLSGQRDRLAADQQWLEQRRRRIALAAENRGIRTQEILSAASSG